MRSELAIIIYFYDLNIISLFHRIIAIICFLFLFSDCFGETIDSNFIRKNLSARIYAIDTEASAVVLYESMYYNVTLTDVVRKIIKILKPEALKLANVTIDYYGTLSKDFVSKVTAVTYNLNGNKVVKTEIDRKDIYFKKVREGYHQIIFSLPNVKEGSIIDYSYEIDASGYYNLPKWHVQGLYPKLISEYNLICPSSHKYSSIIYVADSLKNYPSEEAARNSTVNFCRTYRELFSRDIPSYSTLWIRRNVPAAKPEPFVQTLQNYMENVEFRMQKINLHANSKNEQPTWESLTENQLKSEPYNEELNGANRYLNKIIDSIVEVDTSAYGKIRNIYFYVRSHFRDDQYFKFYGDHTLSQVFAAKNGTKEEINLVLTAMLLHAHVPAAPVFLATTGYLSANDIFPTFKRFNHTVSAVTYGTGYILLDASDRNNIFGQLPPYCFNGYARVIKKPGEALNLTPDLIKDKSILSVNITNLTDTDATIQVVEKTGVIRSSIYRKSWDGDKEKQKNFLDEIVRGFPENIEISERNIDNIPDPDTNLVIRFSGKLKFDKESSSIFLNAVLFKNFTINPFAAVSRKYPVEFPYKNQYVYTMNITLPPGYEPENLPASFESEADSGGVVYKKKYTYNADLHILSAIINYNQQATYFSVEKYSSLRDFYGEVIRQENDMITLKRTGKK